MLTKSRSVRKRRIRAKVSGTKARPRLSVFRSNTQIYVQLIDDGNKHTIASAHNKDAKAAGTEIGQKAIKAKVSEVVFDRGGYQYHGKIKMLADAAREAGLKF